MHEKTEKFILIVCPSTFLIQIFKITLFCEFHAYFVFSSAQQIYSYWVFCNNISLSARILHRAPPPPAPSGPKFSNSENCCGSENAMPPKIFWDMEGHRGHFRSKNVFFFKKHILKKIHNKSNYFLNF